MQLWQVQHHQRGRVQYAKDQDYKYVSDKLNGFGMKHIHNRDIQFSEATFDFPDVNLFQLTVTKIFRLVDNASTRASDSGRRKRSSEDKAGGVRPNHIHELFGASDIAANSAVCLP